MSVVGTFARFTLTSDTLFPIVKAKLRVLLVDYSKLGSAHASQHPLNDINYRQIQLLSLKLDLDYRGSKLKEILSLIKNKSK